MWLGWWFAIGACRTSDDPTPPPPTDTHTESDTGSPPPQEISCAPDPTSSLREVCAVHLDAPSAVEIAFVDRDGARPEQVVRSDAAAVDHALVLYFLLPDTEYDYTLRIDADAAHPRTGTFRSGQPELAATVDLNGTGTFGSALVGMASPCFGQMALIIDPVLGAPIWSQQFTSGEYGFLEGVSFTEDRTVLAVVGGSIREVALDGTPVLELDFGDELPNRAHHDVFRQNGLTYVLFQESVEVEGQFVLLDGFYVFDAAGARLGEWHLADHYTPNLAAPLLSAYDVSHANAVWVDEDLQALVSFRHLSAIASIDGDPASPTFGEVHWVLSTPTSDWPSDFSIESTSGQADFFMQHNVFRLENGNLTFLDNRAVVAEHSRVVEVRLDEQAGVATVEREWPLPVHCAFQGGAWRTAEGDPVATCAPIRQAWQLDAATGDTEWSATAECSAGFGTYIPRFVPLDW